MGRKTELILKPLLLGFFIIVLLGLVNTLWVNSNTEWKRTYQSDFIASDSAMTQTQDGYAICIPDSLGYAQTNYTIISTDQQGKVISTQRYGRPNWEETISSASSTSDGGLILTGTSSPQLFQWYLYVSKLNSEGQEEWHTDIGYHECSGYDIVEGFNDGFIAVGKRDDAYERYPNLYIVRLNSEGSFLWDKEFGGDNYDVARAVTYHDYHFIVAGSSDTDSESRDAIWVLKLNSLGDVVWESFIDGPEREVGSDIEVTHDGDYIVVGSTGSWGEGGSSFIAIRLDSDGNEVWRNTYSSKSWDNCHSVTVTSDGGFLLVGTSGMNIMTIKVDSEGNEIWRKTLGGLFSFEEGYWGFENSNGNYVVGGISGAFFKSDKIWLMELKEGGLPTESIHYWLGLLVKGTIASTILLVLSNLVFKWKGYQDSYSSW